MSFSRVDDLVMVTEDRKEEKKRKEVENPNSDCGLTFSLLLFISWRKRKKTLPVTRSHEGKENKKRGGFVYETLLLGCPGTGGKRGRKK